LTTAGEAPGQLPPSGFDEATLEAAGFPTISYQALRVGEEFVSDERHIRPSDVEAYAFAVADHDPWFFAQGPFGGPIAHPTLLANQALFLRHSRYVVPAGLHARMSFEFVDSIALGTRARTRGRVVDKYVRRDKPYMVTEFVTSDDTGRPLVRGRFTQMLFASEAAPTAGTASRPARADPTVDRSASVDRAAGRSGVLEPGQCLGPLRRVVTQRQIDVYSGVRPRSIHTDEEWARAKGFRTTLAQGMMSTAYVSELMTRSVGEGFVVGGRMDVRFLRPVLAEDVLAVEGEVTALTREGDRTRIHVEVTCQNQAGQRTLAGSASGLGR